MKSKPKELLSASIAAMLMVPAALCLSGYSYGSSRDSEFLGGFFIFVVVAVGVLVLFAWVLAISLFIKAGKAKGHSMENAGLLWFVGIFATPIVVGMYVASLPDKRPIRINETLVEDSHAEELPAI